MYALAPAIVFMQSLTLSALPVAIVGWHCLQEFLEYPSVTEFSLTWPASSVLAWLACLAWLFWLAEWLAGLAGLAGVAWLALLSCLLGLLGWLGLLDWLAWLLWLAWLGVGLACLVGSCCWWKWLAGPRETLRSRSHQQPSKEIE